MDQQRAAAASGLEARILTLKPGLDLLALPACVLDHDLHYLYVNAAYAASSGREAAEMIGRTPDEVFRRKPTDSRREHLRRALAGETVVFNRLTLEGPMAGQWLRAHYSPLRDADDSILGVLVVVVDIQELKDAEVALAERERQLSLIMDSVGMPITYVDRNHVIRFANQPSAEWSGRTPETMIGQPIDAVAPREVQSAATPLLDRALAGETITYEREALWPGRESRRIRGHMIPDRDPSGAVLGVLIVLIDIEEDHQLRRALEEKESQLRYFAENIPEAIAVVDREFRYVFANKMFQLSRGHPLQDLVGRKVREIIGEEAAVQYFDPYIERLQRGETCSHERLFRGHGEREARWHMVRLAPIMVEGRFNGYYVVSSDIHDIKLAQERFRAQEAQLRLYTDNIPDSVAYLDRERRILFANLHFAEQRGLTPDEIIGRTTAEVMGEETATWIAERTQRVLDRGEVATYERLVTLPGSATRWFHVKAVPHLGDSGEVVGMYVVGHDISEVKEAQGRIEDKERQLRQVIDSIPTPMCYVDAEGLYRYVNDAFLAYVGMPVERIVGRPVREILGEERWALMAPYLERVKAGESLAVERLVRFADGRARWMTVRLAPRLSGGEYLGYYATTSDIHEQKVVEQELRRANSILSAHFDNTPLAVIERDTDLRISRWSGQAEAIFGWKAAEALGRPLQGWRHVFEDDEEAVTRMVRGLVEGRERQATLLHRNYRKDGSVIWVEWHNSALHDEAGRVISILSLAQDVSSRIQAEERLQYMATHDGLTGLPNSVLLHDRLDAAISRARRARRLVGVMFLDLDHFKDVNDTLGHRVGDGLLKELSRRIRGALRQSDVLARISGDEFVVILEDLPDAGAHERVARLILEEVRRPFSVDGHEIHVSGSLGLALHPDDGVDTETLLKNADAAMYHAKELGRNGFRMFSNELAERRTRRMVVETALRRALKSDELVLHFQPIVDMVGGKVRRAEALLRWNDPEKGLQLPQGFIPLAEESGLGHAIGHWVMEAACHQARKWRDAGLGDIAIGVNLSAGQLRDTSMVTDLKDILQRTGCEPEWLQFEITETSMVRDVEGASVVLAQLRALGVRVAIDDFGTGFSSLSHLRHLPVDVLKIDKAFVADIGTARARKLGGSSGGAAIVSAVIGLARGLGLEVVAEGVEKRTQLDFLAREGCHACQGYLLCRPLPADEFEAWLRSRARRPRRATARKGKKKPVRRA